MRKIALFGGSFNPVGNHHIAVVRQLLAMKKFDEIVVVPCGPRPDKRQVEDVAPVYRAAMLAMAFEGLAVKVDMDDMELDCFTYTRDLEHKYSAKGQVWHVVGHELVKGGRRGVASIQTEWVDGDRLWRKSRFVVAKRRGLRFVKEDLPPQAMVIDPGIEGASTAIREKCFNHQSIEALVPAKVAAYIERYNLYRGRLPEQRTLHAISSPRMLIVADEQNARAMTLKASLMGAGAPKDPNVIVAIGGDGHMIRTIRRYASLRIPFLGLNAGHRGYLLNDLAPDRLPEALLHLVVHHLPLLHVHLTLPKAKEVTVLGVNEAWVERQTGQTAWIELRWNRGHAIPKIEGDGILVSTAAGSTGYAKHLCGFSLPVHMRELLLVGMGIAEPSAWQNTIFSGDSVFQLRALDPIKRPLRAFVDGVEYGAVLQMAVRVSRIASVELAFIQGEDIVAKHTRIQLPYFITKGDARERLS
jgi:nicotinate (nicotinamide) nucleotide adenylyltransferase